MIDAATGRARLLAELATYAPADGREREMVERVRAFVAGHEDCFERTQLAGHVTGSAWIVDRAGTAALLLHSAKSPGFGECILPLLRSITRIISI